MIKVKKWREFSRKYKNELQSKKGLLKDIGRVASKNKTITLLYAAKDRLHNNAVVLRNLLRMGER